MWLSKPCVTNLVSSDNLELSARSQSDLDDQHDYDSVASDEDTDQEPLPSTGATRNNRARVCPFPFSSRPSFMSYYSSESSETK